MSSSKKTSTIIQFIFSLLAVLNAWGGAFFLAVIGLLQGLQFDFDFNLSLDVFMLAAVSFLTGCLVIPSAVYSLRFLLGKQEPMTSVQSNWMWPTLLVFIFPLAVWLGNISAQSEAAWFLLPFFHILAISIPVLWLLSLAVRNLPVGSPQRRWGVFASGLVLGPTLIMLAEGFALLVLLVAAGVWLAAQPQLLSELNTLAESWASSPTSQEELLKLLLPYILTPAVFAFSLFFTALVVPLIEEIFKPIGVWLLLGRKLTPAAGFTAGAISGAGYALFESLLLTIGGDNWTVVILARLGTTTIHVLTSALTGWALVGAWRKRHILRLVGVYIAAVIFHGLWNGMTILSAFSSMAALIGSAPEWDFAVRIGEFAPYVLGFFSILAFGVIIWANRKLSGANHQSRESVAVSPQS